MKCPKCGKIWNQRNTITSDIYICPYCRDNFSADGQERENISLVFKKIVDDYGDRIVEDVDRLNALLMDYAPHSDKERKLIIMAIREGVADKLLKLVNATADMQQDGIRRCVNLLVSEIWITEIAAEYVIAVISNGIGINAEIGSIETNFCDQRITDTLIKTMDLSSMELIYSRLKKCKTIGYKAFASNTMLTELIVPDTITAIYPRAFLNCRNLRKISLPYSIKLIGNRIFEGCIHLEDIEVTDNTVFKVVNGVLIDKVSKKTLRALNNEEIDVVEIADGIRCIAVKTFDNCQVKCISIPMTVIMIEKDAFYLTTKLEEFVVDPKNKMFGTKDGVLHERNGKVLVRYPQGRKNVSYYIEDSVEKIEEKAFSRAIYLQTVTFNRNLRIIGKNSFEYCYSIENLILPNGIETIEDRAFQYCRNLRGAMLSNKIKEIGDCAFYNCSSLETISIPQKVERIGNFAFAFCKKLKHVVIQENVTFMGDGVFLECNSIEIFIRNNIYIEAYCQSRNIKYQKI